MEEKTEIQVWNISLLFAKQQDILGETNDQIGPLKKKTH